MTRSRKSWLRPRVVVPAGTDNPAVIRKTCGPALDARQSLFEAGGAGEVQREDPIGQALQMNVRVDQTRESAATQGDDLGVPTCGRPRVATEADDPAV